MSDSSERDAPPWLRGGGEIGALMRSFDWSATPVGPPEQWPPTLRTMVSILLMSEHAMFIYWGEQLVQFYNDAYRPILGSTKHPAAMGALGKPFWAEIWHVIGPMLAKVWDGGATYVKDGLLLLDRHGFTEECYFDYAYTPIRDENGEVAGIFVPCGETTRRILLERRLKMLGQLSARIATAKTQDEACQIATSILEDARSDLPFALIYLVDDDGQTARLAASAGIDRAHPAAPATIPVVQHHGAWPFASVAAEPIEISLSDLPSAQTLPGGPWPEPPAKGLVLPLSRGAGYLVVGLSPRLIFDEAYRSFVNLVADHVAAAVQNTRAYAEERRRAEKLAELDRAKTTFFSNVSHEFRTPLTLILGPIEDALGHSTKALVGADLEAVHRSAVRLLRLVNSLLDFARIESGRLQLAFVPTDLPSHTRYLASSFQSLFDRAGLRLVIECDPLEEPTYVDPTHWEKIVLNLMSNAFKFTFQGRVEVRLRRSGDHVELTVSDTGQGIPARELPRMFERFHRVEGAKGRSYEGTGIGLSLVQELVKLHGGSAAVASTEGQGTTFTIRVPLGKAHLPPDQVRERASETTSSGAAPYLLEASQWVVSNAPDEPADAPLDDVASLPSASQRKLAPGRVLLVDDNPDMRAYLTRVLKTRWQVRVAHDGVEALELARNERPDLILSDVMMPNMDGVTLLHELRADPRTMEIPVILLSARAGEEAVLEGLHQGADDYVAKPFSARELMARVETHLEMARMRRRWAAELEQTNRELESFSYSVSHDLRAPLRAIDGFSSELLASYGDAVDDRGKHYLERVRSGAQRMSLLIDALLRLSRVSRTPMKRERVDLSALARDVIGEIREHHPARTLEAHVEPGLVADADPALVRSVLENLIANAWKFTSRRDVARIIVGSDQRDGQSVFHVRDNGVGFDSSAAQKLFAPFQRLHSDKEFEGTGIGLATVNRIVTRHGGRIWAEAERDKGATFLFTLAAPA